MPFVCAFVCGPKPRKKKAPNNKTMDFRRADPNYVNFVPRTCMDAIDLFNRHRNLGMAASIFPECFVHCARALPDGELDKFHRFIVAPSGDIDTGGEKPTPIDLQIEKERKRLLAECEVREMAALSIAEEPDEPMGAPASPMCQDDEKFPNEEEYINILTSPQ
jgi:hypothetical protein